MAVGGDDDDVPCVFVIDRELPDKVEEQEEHP
jgi:hypothetical protein